MSTDPRTPAKRRAPAKRETTITKREIVEHVTVKSGCSATQAKQAIDCIFEYMKDQLAAGRRIEIRDYFIFEVGIKKAHSAHNPKTMHPVLVPEKRVVRFKAGRALRESVEKGGQRAGSAPRPAASVEPKGAGAGRSRPVAVSAE